MKTTTTTQLPPPEKPWLSDAEMNSLSAAYMLAIIALIVGIGIYAAWEAAMRLIIHIRMRRYAKLVAKQMSSMAIEKQLTELAMKQREGKNEK